MEENDDQRSIHLMLDAPGDMMLATCHVLNGERNGSEGWKPLVSRGWQRVCQRDVGARPEIGPIQPKINPKAKSTLLTELNVAVPLPRATENLHNAAGPSAGTFRAPEAAKVKLASLISPEDRLCAPACPDIRTFN